MNISLKACGSAIPKKYLSNDDLANMVDTSDEWIFSRTGIRGRHVLLEDESLSDLCIEASKKALENSGIKAEDIKNLPSNFHLKGDFKFSTISKEWFHSF